jgi:phenylacetate-coenzyme A ligase PaaK-like adenylate-forming protein
VALNVTLHAYAQAFDARIADALPRLAAAVPAFADRLTAAGVSPDDLTGVDALSRVPVLGKDDLISLQEQDPPYGGLLAGDAVPRRVYQSPGPLYEPEPDEPDPWRWAPALEAAGFGAGDAVLCAFGYHLTPAGAMFEEAARSLGCAVVPGGVGNVELQARACRDLGVTGYIGMPSYLKKLLHALEADDETRLRRAFVSAEPLPGSLRAWLRERVPVIRQGYGTAEAGNLGYECELERGLHVPEDALVQVCSLDDGRPLAAGEEGEVVATLFRTDYAVVRFGTGDLSAFLDEPCPCGRPTPRLAGWLGRVGDAVKVRGMFLHPRQVRAAMDGTHQLVAYRFVVDRIAHRDELRCEIQPRCGADTAALVAAVRARIRDILRFNAEIVVVDSLDPTGPILLDTRRWT